MTKRGVNAISPDDAPDNESHVSDDLLEAINDAIKSNIQDRVAHIDIGALPLGHYPTWTEILLAVKLYEEKGWKVNLTCGGGTGNHGSITFHK